MDIEIWSVGKIKLTADPEFQEPAIREAMDQRGDVAGAVLDHTDSERSDISYDEYARVTGDVPGLVLFEGWLTGNRDAPPPVPVERESAPFAEPDHAEWHRWMYAQGYKFDDDSYQGEAFMAGMQAGRGTDAGTAPVPDRTAVTETSLRLALAFIAEVRDGAYGDPGRIDAQQMLYEIEGLSL